MPHNPASIVRLLYGERTADEKTAPKRFLLNPADNSLTSGLAIGQDHGLRGGGPVSISTDWQIPVIPWETTSWFRDLVWLENSIFAAWGCKACGWIVPGPGKPEPEPNPCASLSRA